MKGPKIFLVAISWESPTMPLHAFISFTLTLYLHIIVSVQPESHEATSMCAAAFCFPYFPQASPGILLSFFQLEKLKQCQ